MKIISKIIVLFCICTVMLASCKKSEEIALPEDTIGKAIEPVTKLVAMPTTDENELEVSWTNPDDDALMKVSISFAPNTGGATTTPNPIVVNAQKGAAQKISIMVPTIARYVISVVAINKAGARSTAASVLATPYSATAPDLTPVFLKRADTLMSSLVKLYLDGKPMDVWTGFFPYKDGYSGGASFAWGHGGAFSGYAALKEASEAYPAYKSKVTTLYDARLLTGFDKYRSAPNGLKEAYAVLPSGGSNERYYDDNIWIGIDMIDLYKLTKNAGYLARAKMVWEFTLAGTDEKMGGGVYWKEFGNTKNTCSSAPAAVLAAKLYLATNDPVYLKSAKDLYAWTKATLQDPSDYLYWDNVKLSVESNPNSSLIIDKPKYSYNSGQPMQAAALLYNITGESQYLTDAQNIAQAAYKKWFTPFTSYTMGESFRILAPDHVWFQAIMFRGFIELYHIDGNKTYVKAYQKTMANAWLSTARDRSTNLIKTDFRGGTTQTEYDILFQGACLEMISRLALLEHEGL